MQIKIIYDADTKDTDPWISRGNPVHQGAARRAEVVCHGVAGSDGTRLAVGREVVAAAQVGQVRVGNEKVGRKHGASKFSAVATVAGKRCHETRALGGLVVGKPGVSNPEMNENR
jgi:hypothetical protein